VSDGLNGPQREAVETTEGPLLVLAGAGSGKTRVITYRVAELLRRGVDGHAILAVSFTNKAANEMRERVIRLVGQKAADKVTMCTFHALGLMILKAEREALGMRSFTIYDQADQLGVVRELLRAIKVDDRRFDPKAILHRISMAKNKFIAPGKLEVRGADDYDMITAEVYPRYQEAMNAYHAFDFDDLIVRPVTLFAENPLAKGRWAARYRYVLVDEYQDTNAAQLELVRALSAPHGNLCVVGDDDQSIYAWRGAVAANILDFGKQFRGARIIKLEENYRSTMAILEVANAVISRNAQRYGKTLFSRQAGGDPVELVIVRDSEAEAKFVCDEIEALRGRGFGYGDFAVLYRANIQAGVIEEALVSRRLPYRMIGGQKLFERKEVKDVIAYLRAALNPVDELALRRVVNYPARGVGDGSLEHCAAYAKERRVPLHVALRAAAEGRVEAVPARGRAGIAEFIAVLDRTRARLDAGGAAVGGRAESAQVARGLVDDIKLIDDLRAGAVSPAAAQRRIDSLEAFIGGLAAYQAREPTTKLSTYLERLMLASSFDTEEEGEPGQQITLTTLHAAKGLEYPVVFLVGMEEGLLPHARTLYPQGPDVVGEADVSEERRLAYVGVTRARTRLFLTRCLLRKKQQKEVPRTPSRFLGDIPVELLKTRDLTTAPPPSAPEELAAERAMLAGLMAAFDD